MENEIAVTYDYKTVRVKRELETMLTDAYSNLGWEVTNTTLAEGSLSYVNVSFKRDRKIQNKMELNKIQEKVNNVLANIEKLQSKKKSAGVPEGVTVGCIGALAFGGGMSMCLTLSGVAFMVGGIALGVVGIGIALLGWLTHNKIKRKKVSQIEPMLESEFDKLSDLCESAVKLIK